MEQWYSKIKLAHRGLHNGIYPENSLGAFQNAIDHGFAIELDARLLSDSTIVVIHDQTTGRMCGVDKDLSELTIADLKDFRLSTSDYVIPTLKEVLDLVNGKVPVMIELKPTRKHHQFPQKMYDCIKDYKGDLAVKSFDPFMMIWFRKNAPHVIRGMLASIYNMDSYLSKFSKRIVSRLYLYRFVKPHFISYNHLNLPNKYVSSKNIPVLAWTITTPKIEEQALKHADNVIFEDYIPSSNISK